MKSASQYIIHLDFAVILGTVPEMQNQPATETCIPSTSAPGNQLSFSVHQL